MCAADSRGVLTFHAFMAIMTYMSRPINTESVFRAVAHPTRRRMLQLLRDREMSAGELVKQFHHSQPVTSRHLRVLHLAGLITMRRKGVQRWYRLAAKPLDQIGAWLASVQPRSTNTVQRSVA